MTDIIEHETEQPNIRLVNQVNDLDREATNEEAKAQAKEQAQAKANFDASPIGLWQSAIRDVAPVAFSFVPDLAVTPDEAETLAVGLAPALAKHFPINEQFQMPVEITAIVTLYIVFNPKIQAIKAKQLQEVSPDATPENP